MAGRFRRPVPASDGEPITHRRFEFRVQGSLSESARRALDGLVIVDAPQEVIIFGEVVDESHLVLLALTHDLRGRSHHARHPLRPDDPNPMDRSSDVINSPPPNATGRT